MPTSIKLAIRFLGLRRPGLSRFTGVAGIIGIAASTSAFVCGVALLRGFHGEFERLLLSSSPHITVTSLAGRPIRSNEQRIEELSKLSGVDEVKSVSEAPILLVGKDSIEFAVMRSNSAVSGVSPGNLLADRLGLKTGETAELVTVVENEAPRRIHVLVGEPFNSGLYEIDSSIVMAAPKEFAAIIGQPFSSPTKIEIRTTDPIEAPALARETKLLLGDEYSVIDWQTSNKLVFEIFTLERTFGLVLTVLIAVFAAITIAASVAINAAERRSEIAILRTIGARYRTVALTFALQGLILGSAGYALGVAIAFILFWTIDPQVITSVVGTSILTSGFQFQPEIADFVAAFVAVFILSLGSSLYPAYRAAAIKPIESFRRT